MRRMLASRAMSSHEHWREELQSAWLYRESARVEPDAAARTMFGELAAEAAHWASRARVPLDVFVPGRCARVVARLVRIPSGRGIEFEEARTVARKRMSDPEHALDTLAREQLGLDPDELGSPWGAAWTSFLAGRARRPSASASSWGRCRSSVGPPRGRIVAMVSA